MKSKDIDDLLDEILTALLWRVPVQYIDNRPEAKKAIKELIARERIKELTDLDEVIDIRGYSVESVKALIENRINQLQRSIDE